jgi:hypothetical protein
VRWDEDGMKNNAPVNVLLENPTQAFPKWEEESKKWRALNRSIFGNRDFYPLTIKGAYVIWVIHSICSCVDLLLKDKSVNSVNYITAYGVFASGLDLLGRCVRGNDSTLGSSKDLITGYKWLASTFFVDYRNDYESVPNGLVFVQTSKFMYSILNLVALRHFAAHGQATSREVGVSGYEFGYIDFEILAHMPPLLAKGLDEYWSRLQASEALCNNLAKAKVIAFRNTPINISWSLFEAVATGKYYSINEIFNRFNWQV